MWQKIINHKILSFIKDKNIRLLIVVGLAFRLVLSLLYLHVSRFPDSGTFLELLDRLLAFNLKDYSGLRSPGYPLLMFFAFGSTILTAIYQFFLGVASSVLWYKTLINIKFTSKNALLIALFLESFLHVYFYETAILIETLALFLISIMVYELSNGYLENNSFKKDALMAFVLSFLTLTKPFFAYLPFLIFGFYVIKDFRFKKLFSKKIIIVVATLFTYFGWSYINKINTGYFVSTTFFGLNLSQNCVYFAENTSKDYEWIGNTYARYRDKLLAENDTITDENKKNDMAMTVWHAHNELLLKTDNNFPKLSSELGKYAVATIKKNPKEYAKQVVYRSWLDFWYPFLAWNKEEFVVPYVNDVLFFIWRIQHKVLYLIKLSFVLLIPFYIYLFLKNRKVTFSFMMIIIVFATSLLQGMVTYGTNAKYSFPFEFIMVIVVLQFIKKYVPLPYFAKKYLE